uniref:NEDD8-activating enzyme E1 regulatory subunit n=1 Tax=Globisporangium ultimum (strain ATCC 200006 / CBS 805.95 / DAOM BR144) TaxID=431595 RepID=K3W937_GLOUD
MSTNKYDRQLRLWGAAGQQRLASTHVLLVHASATGAETLKNLVLPGVQQFTVLDDRDVMLADVTNNFFVSTKLLGRSRAQVVTELLLEMNSDVSGSFRHANPLHVLQTEPNYLDQFSLVIATQCDEATVALLGDLCAQKNLPLLVVHSYGLVGYFRLQIAQHAILDSKNDPPIHELRISKPFPALQTFVDEFDLETLSSIEHAHVPFVVILLKAAAAWKTAHDDRLPSTFPEKAEFKNLIQSMAKGPVGHEVNFIEATNNAYKAYVAPLVPDEVAHVLSTARQLALNAATPEFWLLARSLADFVDQNDGILPITGVVPDMTASTETYVALQQVYFNKAKEDAAKVLEILQKHLSALSIPAESIPADKVDAFCKNAYNIGMLNTKSIAEELKAVDLSAIDLEEEDPKQSPLIWYFMMRALTAFISECHRHPGSVDGSIDDDAQWLVTKVKALIGESSDFASWVTLDHAKEITRSCEVELHNIAAIMGGVASQEAVKIITHQFVPLNHTYVFNGIAGIAGAYDL